MSGHGGEEPCICTFTVSNERSPEDEEMFRIVKVKDEGWAFTYGLEGVEPDILAWFTSKKAAKKVYKFMVRLAEAQCDGG